MPDRWLEDISKALGDLGGEAHLSSIYTKVLESRQARTASLGEYQAWVRNCLQQNSRGKGHDVFAHVGPLRSGRWRLK